MKGNREFILLDDQAVVFDMCRKIMSQCLKDMKKRTIIIQGGPGTGKSVLAVNLLKDLTVKGLNASYVTKNSAPIEKMDALEKELNEAETVYYTEVMLRIEQKLLEVIH